VNGDTASVEIIIYDEFGTEIGIGAALVGGLVSSYTYLSVPIVYSGSSLPAYYSLNFTTAGYGFQPSFGTRFLIDDLILNDATGIKDETTNIFNLYPNPASDVLNLDVSEMRDHATYKIIDMSGKLIDTGSISKTNNYISTKTVNDGLYLLEFITGEETQHRLFVVRH
nr:T9SS type A sorting domain-containing protein [Bacteroidia bacterium]